MSTVIRPFASVGFGNQQPKKKETEQEMRERQGREALEARSRAGGGDPRYADVPKEVLKRHEYERALSQGRDTRYLPH